MNKFIHSKNGIWINGVFFDHAEFSRLEPSYSLPKGVLEQVYRFGRVVLKTEQGEVIGKNNAELDKYIQKLDSYKSDKLDRTKEKSVFREKMREQTKNRKPRRFKPDIAGR